MNRFDSVEEALEELRNGKIILVTDDPDRENEGDVRQSLPQQKILTLWQLMERDLSACRCLRNMSENCSFPRW